MYDCLQKKKSCTEKSELHGKAEANFHNFTFIALKKL